MNDSAMYPTLLALHLLAVAAFGAVMLVVAFALPAFGKMASSAQAAELRRLVALNRFIATPSLLLLWALGITLAVKGGWFTAGWLHAKIGLVTALSALHGYQSGRLRRLSNGATLSRSYSRIMPVTMIAVMIAIVALVTTKPF